MLHQQPPFLWHSWKPSALCSRISAMTTSKLFWNFVLEGNGIATSVCCCLILQVPTTCDMTNSLFWFLVTTGCHRVANLSLLFPVTDWIFFALIKHFLGCMHNAFNLILMNESICNESKEGSLLDRMPQ